MTDTPLVRLLTLAVTQGLDDLHAELARRGHATVRPVHGYALNAIASGCATASDLAPRLSMTKQGAAKVLQHLLDEGYVRQEPAAAGDARRKPVRLTPRGRRLVALSAQVQADIEREWVACAGAARTRAMRECLEQVVRSRTPDGELPPLRTTW